LHEASVDANVILGASSLPEPQKSPNPAEANANPVSFQREGESWIHGESPKTRSLRRNKTAAPHPPVLNVIVISSRCGCAN
jgi:hypothetical protein